MDIYRRKSYWKWYLAAAATLIVSVTLAYTYYLAQKLSLREEQQASQFAEAIKQIISSNISADSCDLELHRRIIAENTTIPVIMLDEGWNIQEYRNIGDNSITEMDTTLVRKALNDMVNDWADTIPVVVEPYFTNYLVYSHSYLLRWLKWYPYLQLLLIGAFIAMGYLGFSASRRAEENRVWLGMAKETAHQLGTPITAIMGWLETLQLIHENDDSSMEMYQELGKDVKRLELVSERFSKIGAAPDLKPENLYETLSRNVQYMQKRSPRKVTYHYPAADTQPPLTIKINAPLFDWVVENLIRNAIDAMEQGQGQITIQVYEETRWIGIDVSDTGKGIPSSKFKTVFQPGYSTKTRGWGLGLSLARRIVVLYHRGKIFVKKSVPGQGTTFTIKLPK
jgi:two-component sensor histidine kinase